MKKELKPKLARGRMYVKDGVWVVRYEVKKRNKIEIKCYPILPESAKGLNDPYDQAKETCFELVISGETFDTYAKLWSTSEWIQNLQHYFETTPQEQIDAAWEATEKQFGNIGPTMDEFLGIEEEEEQLQMIPKSQMKEGWYNGHCRNAHMAYWDASAQMFFYLRYSFNFYMDKIEHFDDVKELRQDGFIPIERVERINWVDVNRIKEQVGY